MKLRRLGSAGPVVSAIGLGAGSSTTDFGRRDDAVQIATMQRAIDLGVTFFDTADRCMNGRHERLLGQAIKGRRNEVTIASKFGNLDLPDGRKGYNGRPDFVPKACEASLRQLGVDVIDFCVQARSACRRALYARLFFDIGSLDAKGFTRRFPLLCEEKCPARACFRSSRAAITWSTISGAATATRPPTGWRDNWARPDFQYVSGPVSR
ncbi:MAG: hypothetical protein A3G81_25310 [Betaproteobacteria bacterium RIFCSPLOWO2_12_FULL_65_14]|nr:MAG: hypothetical protein A3G81_25310 [Betaproteobacteria bacterium RIFCSPLOWO2_12_FULL_65_14]